MSAPFRPLVVATLAFAGLSRSAAAQSCSPSTDSRTAVEWLDRAISAVGADRFAGRILDSRATVTGSWNYQSDRPWYPPYLTNYITREYWYDPATGVEGSAPPGTGTPKGLLLSGTLATFARRDTALNSAAPLHAAMQQTRPLNPLAVLYDWKKFGDARVTGRCLYREFPRVVLTRKGDSGPERLLLDPKTGFPVMYGRTEPHYLWGQVPVEYIWTTWQDAGPGYYPLQSYRMVDGTEDASRALEITQTGSARALARDSAPSLTIPDSVRMTGALDAFLVPSDPDTVRVGPAAFVLHNPGYRELVALERDTVFVMDATQGEERARRDSVWIGKLFPGRHAVAVVVTDLAWPHIAGVRFWVASGATIISHRTSRTLLEQAVNRRWTLAPDKLERSRAAHRLVLRVVDDSISLAGGRVSLYAINGIGSEGALMAFIRDPGVLWASDYFQNPSQPALYTTEVVRAVQRAGITPTLAVAQHVPPTPWEKVRALAP